MLKETLKVLVPNSLTLGVVTLTEIELTLKITLLVLSVVYTSLHIAVLWRRLRTKHDEPTI